MGCRKCATCARTFHDGWARCTSQVGRGLELAALGGHHRLANILRGSSCELHGPPGTSRRLAWKPPHRVIINPCKKLLHHVSIRVSAADFDHESRHALILITSLPQLYQYCPDCPEIRLLNWCQAAKWSSCPCRLQRHAGTNGRRVRGMDRDKI